VFVLGCTTQKHLQALVDTLALAVSQSDGGTPSALKSSYQKLLVKIAARSDVIECGMPWSLTMQSTNTLATFGAE
jgi:hypothetical protein